MLLNSRSRSLVTKRHRFPQLRSILPGLRPENSQRDCNTSSVPFFKILQIFLSSSLGVRFRLLRRPLPLRPLSPSLPLLPLPLTLRDRRLSLLLLLLWLRRLRLRSLLLPRPDISTVHAFLTNENKKIACDKCTQMNVAVAKRANLVLPRGHVLQNCVVI